MSYIKKSLTENEKIIYTFNFPIYTFLPSFISIFLGIIFFVFALILNQTEYFQFYRQEVTSHVLFFLSFYFLIILGIYNYFKIKSLEMAITNKRCIKALNFFSLKTSIIRLEKIESVDIDQTFFGKRFNYGNIILGSIGENSFILENIDDPIDVQKKINKVLDKYK
jgi:uncharacterized membrane protein YdbT with pleckstrin-like domain